MTPSILTVLTILGAAVILMTTELLRADIVALITTVALALAGILTTREAFSGLSRSAVVTILAVFILTSGLHRTGVTRQMGLALQRLTGDRPIRMLLVIMLGGAFLSLFMNNIAAAAVLMPALMDVSRRTKVSPSKLLMPLAFSVNLGGTATLLATSNILISDALRDLGLPPFGLFDFAPVGLPLVAAGTLYMLLVGRRLLPSISPVDRFGSRWPGGSRLAKTYALEERLGEVRIPPESPLVGKTIAASQIGEKLGISVLAVCRNGELACMAPQPDQVIEVADTLVVAGRDERIQQLAEWAGGVIIAPGRNNGFRIDDVALTEVILAPRSHAADRTLKELHFREKYALSAVALWRGDRSYRTDVGDMRLRFGDALLVHGPRAGMDVLRADHDFLALTEVGEPLRTRRAWLAGLIVVLALAASAVNLLPIAVSMMVGALCMVVTECLTMDEAYRSVEWKTVFLVAGMLPAGIALTKSGAAAWLGELLITRLMTWGPLALAGGMLVLATLLTQVISGQVTAVVLTPIAVATAQQMGAEPRAIAMAVAMGCSMVYMTPTGHPVNVFVMGPGGYSFRDFLRVGLPLTLIGFAITLVMLPIFWPLQ